ncbi:MAG: arginine--tRNA ligase [Cytophagaceae bacterium]|jgi:arginyl-tRNA synthetase|nr:arginine--tRNA ligase [Cytophagaceae bacterium]
MILLENKIQENLAAAFKALYAHELSPESIGLQPTRKEFEGNVTFTTFPYTKPLQTSPEKLGEALGQYLVQHSGIVARFNVVKGFLNILISDQAWIELFNTSIQQSTFGTLPSHNKKIMVEYSSPNTNKPLHLGHLRNNFLGYSVAEILKASGAKVVKVNLVNDRGIHICKSMLAYQKNGKGQTPFNSGIKGDHLVGNYYVEFDKMLKAEAARMQSEGKSAEEIERQNPVLLEAQELLVKWERGDAATVDLWKTMNAWVYEGFDATYRMIGVDFDHFYYESNTYLLGKEIVEEGLAKEAFFRKEDGSVWIDLTNEGLDQKLLLRGDGTSVYMTQDLGTAELKYKDFHCDHSIYVVGNEQDYHFKVLQLILQKLEKPYAPGIFHLSYGMVDLPSGKMKSREGTVVDADDLVQEMIDTAKQRTLELGKIEGFTEEEANTLYRQLALGALKYFLLRVDPKKRMLFNPEESIDFHGNTGPFIQYTHARIAALRRRAEQLGIEPEAASNYQVLHPTEREVIVHVSKYESVIAQAAQHYAPSLIAQYAYDLAKEFNRMYTEVSVFNDPSPGATAFRVQLSVQVGQVIKKAMGLLGIEVPERM